MKTTNLYRLCLAVLISCFLAAPVYGQKKVNIPTARELKKKTKEKDLCTVTGLVVDNKTGKPLSYVTVGFGIDPAFMLPDLFAVTDEQGRFTYQLPAGTYGVMVSCVGYQYQLEYPVKLEDPKKPVEVETFSMVEKPVTLDEVLVKPLVNVTSSEIVYNLAQDPDRETMNLHEILDKVPMVDRTPDGKLYVENPNTSFLIVRNGKKDALFGNKEMLDQTLKALPAKAFQKVTVKLMPESRYGDYKYVLSIDADEVNQLFGVINQNYDTYDVSEGKLLLQSALLSSYNRFRINAGGDFSNTNTPESKQTLEQTFHEEGTHLTQKGQTHRNGESFGGITTFSYDLGEQHFVTAQISYKNTRSRNYEDLSVWRSSGGTETSYTSWTRNRNTGYSLNGYVNYQYEFSKPNRVLNVVYDFAHRPDKQDNDIAFNGEYDPDIVPPWQQGESRNEQHTLQIHYNDPLSKALSLESGTGYIFRDYRTTSRYLDNDGRELADRFYEMESKKHLFNAYLNLRYQSKVISVTLGLKAEYLNDGNGTRITEGTESPQYISQTGFALTPDARVSFLLKDKWINRIGLSYRWLKQRPNIRMMTTRTDYSNPNYIFTGNPKLDDEDTHHVGLDFSIRKGPSISFYGQYSGNNISRIYYTDEQGRVVNTYANDGLYRSVGMNFTQAFFINKKFLVTLMWNEAYEYSRTADRQRTETIRTLLTLNTSLALGRSGSINLSGYYHNFHSSGLENNNIDPFSIRVSTKWQLFNKHLEMEVGCSNLVNFNPKTENELHTATFDQRLVNRTKSIPVYIKLNWRIGSFKVKPVRNARKGAVINDVLTE